MAPITPEEIRSAAEALAEAKPLAGEVCLRTVTGRAYYAAYTATRDAMCAQYGFAPESYIHHETLTDTLARYEHDPLVRQLGTALHALRLRRVIADYSLTKPLSAKTQKLTLGDCATVLRLLDGGTLSLPKVDPAPARGH